MKNLLMNIINDYRTDCDIGAWEKEDFANYLINSGVIVPPCKVGQTVYMPWEWNGTKAVAILEVTRIVDDFTERSPYVNTNFLSDDEDYWVAYNCGRFEFKDFGKTVFLTREEAEKALAERGYKK